MGKINESAIKMIPYMNRRKFVAVDLETSGLSPLKGGRIIEIGAVKIYDGKIIDRFEHLVNPEQKIYGKTTELTGITNEMLEGQPVIGNVLPQFYKFMEDAVIICHNKMFDWDRFLLFFFKKIGISPKNEVIDTLILSKYFLPLNKKYSLDILCKEFGVELNNHHRASADAQATGECLLKMAERFKEKICCNTISDIKERNVEMYQTSLLDNDANDKKLEILKSTDEQNLNIRKVKYWERPITKQKLYKRLYININDRKLYGTVYFDIPEKAWYNKDFPGVLDFNNVQNLVMNFLNLKSIEELCSFKN